MEKSTIQLDGSTESSKTFILRGQDHTLGNALYSIISKYPDVNFCGYTMTHPNENTISFRIQANNVKASDVLIRGLNDLHMLCDEVISEFKKELTAIRTS